MPIALVILICVLGSLVWLAFGFVSALMIIEYRYRDDPASFPGYKKHKGSIAVMSLGGLLTLFYAVSQP